MRWNAWTKHGATENDNIDITEMSMFHIRNYVLKFQWIKAAHRRLEAIYNSKKTIHNSTVTCMYEYIKMCIRYIGWRALASKYCSKKFLVPTPMVPGNIDKISTCDV